MKEPAQIDLVAVRDDLVEVGAIAEVLMALANDDALHILTERSMHWLGSELNEALNRLQNRLSAEMRP